MAVIGWVGQASARQPARWTVGLPGWRREAPRDVFAAQAPRRVFQASTQSSWVLQVVASSASAQSSCGVDQYQILS